jgi:hypothetical protein
LLYKLCVPLTLEPCGPQVAALSKRARELERVCRVYQVSMRIRDPYRRCQILKGSGDSYRNLREIIVNTVFGLRQADLLREAQEETRTSLATGFAL